MLTTVLGADGSVLGKVESYQPAGGYLVADESQATPDPREVAGFQIEIVFGGGLTASQQAVFANAAAKWQSILTGDIPDIGASPGQWGAAVDDVRITASGQAIDGVGGILGSAGPEWIRGGSSLPISGVMTFDSADLANLQANGSLTNVIIHEMGHVLGLGTLWATKGLISGAGGANPIYTGTNAVTEYRRMAGNNSLTSIPVENTGGSGTRDAHWRESIFTNELMTGFLDNGSNPLSRVSAAQYIDLGYPAVNVDATDLYTTTNALPTIGTLTPSVASSPVNAAFNLSVSSATDNGSVSAVNFYRETNGIPGLQAGTTSTVAADLLVGTDNSSPYSVSVSTNALVAGAYTYYARATDNFGALSATVTTTHTISAAVAAPSTPDLATASDTGQDNTDNLTNDSTPTFTGTATPLSTVTLLIDNVISANTTANAAGAWSITLPGLNDGTWSITATATVAAVTSPPSGALLVTIDTIAPTVSTTFSRSPNQVLDALPSEALQGFGTPIYTLVNNTTAQSFNTVFSQNLPGGAFRYSIATANSLTDGAYTASYQPNGAADLAGNLLAVTNTPFRFLRGDFNGDFTVGFDDLLILAQNYGTSSQVNANGDADYDGTIEFSDLLIVAQTYGTSLATGSQRATGLAATPASKRSRAVEDVL